VLDLEEAKTARAKEIASLKERVKKLEQKRKSRTSGLKRLKKGRMIDNIDQDVENTLVDDTQGRMNEEDMFGVNDLDGDEVFLDVSASEKVEQSVKVVEKEVSTADLVTTLGEVVTTAAKYKAITTAATIVTATGIRPKKKGLSWKMVKPKRPLKIKDQIIMDAEVAKNLKAQMQAELEEEERLARLKEEETNIALRKKHFARLRAEKIRSKPPTKAQKRNQICTYLKRMANYKHNQLKNKSFKEIQMFYNNTLKWIEAFVPMVTKKTTEGNEKAQEGSSKRAVDNLEQEDTKRQRMEEENETAKLKRCLEIIPEDDDVTIEATPLSSKSPTIVDYKIYKEGRKNFFKIIRADDHVSISYSRQYLEVSARDNQSSALETF
nr:hypothetical protein [Tanacetum cinerariifolium]